MTLEDEVVPKLCWFWWLSWLLLDWLLILFSDLCGVFGVDTISTILLANRATFAALDDQAIEDEAELFDSSTRLFVETLFGFVGINILDDDWPTLFEIDDKLFVKIAGDCWAEEDTDEEPVWLLLLKAFISFEIVNGAGIPSALWLNELFTNAAKLFSLQ